MTVDRDLGLTTLTRSVTRDVWGDIEDIYFAVPSMYGIGETWSTFGAAKAAALIDETRFVDVRVISKTASGTAIDQVVSRIEIADETGGETP